MAVIQPITLQEIVATELEGKAFVFNTRESRPDITEEIIVNAGTPSEESYGFQAIDEFPIAGVLTNVTVKPDQYQPFFEISGDFQISPSDVVTLRNMYILNPTTYTNSFVTHLPDFLSNKFVFNDNASAPSTQDVDIEITAVNTSSYGGGTLSLSLEDIVDEQGNSETAASRGFSISAGSSIALSGGAFGRVDHTFTLTFTRGSANVLLGGYNLTLKVDDGTDEQFLDIPVVVEDKDVS